ncbi:hypothetical protein [Mycobacterium sp.]|uniref:hypothetical protein n=1 Tax=Mycobacterium sp. TaxID=1785 RepID=UPI003C742EE7
MASVRPSPTPIPADPDDAKTAGRPAAGHRGHLDAAGVGSGSVFVWFAVLSLLGGSAHRDPGALRRDNRLGRVSGAAVIGATLRLARATRRPLPTMWE